MGKLLRWDRWLAKKLGWSGAYTVSAECHDNDCRLCVWIRRILGNDHCAEAARNEGRRWL